jgi:hypothetical protein
MTEERALRAPLGMTEERALRAPLGMTTGEEQSATRTALAPALADPFLLLARVPRMSVGSMAQLDDRPASVVQGASAASGPSSAR